MKNNYFFLLICLIGILLGCSESGLTGPEGPAGPQGATGAVGAAGKDGSIIYSGTGTPAGTLGTTGDYYLDRSSGSLYGPKTATGWGTPIILMGAAGTNGTNGSTTLSGNGTPSGSAGVVGDYYLDKTNYLLYGPKTASGWGAPILLRGADGTQGPAGAAGKDGSIIYSGTGAPANTIGVNGDYYLDKNSGNLYGPKTTAGWGTATVLRGTNGTNGTNGINGSTTLSGNGTPAGAIGNLGDYYLDKTNYLLYGPKDGNGWGVPILLRGADGAQGPMGPAGADGTVIYSGDYFPDPALGKIGDFFIGKYTIMLYGPKTASGWGTGTSLKGTNGTNGTNGNTVLSGRGVPDNSLGVNGDFYLDILTYTMYGPKASGLWGSGTSLKGADGAGSVMAFETTEASTFDWTTKFNVFDGINFKLRMDRHTTFNDTTSVFNLPMLAAVAAQSGSILVYVRIKTTDLQKKWMQLSFTNYDTGLPQHYSYNLTTGATNAAVRIFVSRSNTSDVLLEFDKVRIVVAPASTTGFLGNNVSAMPMQQVMQQLNLKESDFVKLK